MTTAGAVVEERMAGEYRLERRLGSGAMGEVWLGRHVRTGGVAAVKLIRRDRGAIGRLGRFFARERRAIGRLSHPHIVALFEVGPDYLVTAFIDGQDLARRLHSPIDPARAVELTLQIASALVHAHANGVIHRDVKPSNILLDAHGNAFLADFGLASMLDDVDSLSGEAGGTPAFMPPEQAAGGAVGPAADQYALGRTLLVMLAGGTVPTEAEAALGELPASLPAELRAAVARATDPDPARRWPTIDAFAAALARIDLKDHLAPERLAPEVRVRTPFAWLGGGLRTSAAAPDVQRADFRLAELESAGLIPAAAAAAFRAATGYADFGWSVWGRAGRLGPIGAPAALARASEIVVLLHGMFFDREPWGAIALAICRDNAQVVVIAPDLHGAGESRFAQKVPAREHASPEGLMQAVLRWLELLNLREFPAVLVGHSMAGTALLAIGDDDVGARTWRLALTPVFPAYHPAYQRRLRTGDRVMRTLGRLPGMKKLLAHQLIHKAPQFASLSPEHRLAVHQGFMTLPSLVLARISEMFALTVPVDGTRLRRCHIVAGTHDALVPEEIVVAACAAIHLPPENLHRSATGGHYPHILSDVNPEFTARNTNEIIALIDAMLISSRDGTVLSTQVASTLLGSTTQPG